MAQVGFLGLGAMGARMAARLVSAGHDVAVWNRDAGKAEALGQAGARIAGTPRAAAAGAGVVIAMVRDDPASRRVWLDAADGALAGMTPGAVAVECSTLTVAAVRALAAEAAARGVRFVDAPVVGSRPQAEAGALIHLAGGAARDVEAVRPVLAATGGALHHLGDVGAGAAVKLAVNAMLAVQVAGLAEQIGVLGRAGVDVAAALDAIGTTPVASPAARAAGLAMLGERFPPLFPVELVEKDMGYAAAEGMAPMAAATRGVLRDAMARGWGAENLTGIVRLYRPAEMAPTA
ncbi:NAD(P)-dependent oxidoreductase [Roseomonas sp. CCTCC AB2023176]|uniref:NAD(P)-dependent oxidoreductase n=1 Tax=Roseomonas sp. CCTCC AB2023176 TaxID=3342640 RepID=UPI0035DB1DFB